MLIIVARLVPFALIVSGLTLLAIAAGDYWVHPEGAGVTIEDPDQELTTATVGTPSVVAFRVHNPTRHAVQVIGLGTC